MSEGNSAGGAAATDSMPFRGQVYRFQCPTLFLISGGRTSRDEERAKTSIRSDRSSLQGMRQDYQRTRKCGAPGVTTFCVLYLSVNLGSTGARLSAGYHRPVGKLKPGSTMALKPEAKDSFPHHEPRERANNPPRFCRYSPTSQA